jgi:hypothetical protein
LRIVDIREPFDLGGTSTRRRKSAVLKSRHWKEAEKLADPICSRALFYY